MIHELLQGSSWISEKWSRVFIFYILVHADLSQQNLNGWKDSFVWYIHDKYDNSSFLKHSVCVKRTIIILFISISMDNALSTMLVHLYSF